MNSKPVLNRLTGTYLLTSLIIFVLWASWFEIDQTVRTQGQIIPQEKTQIIQAADGGVVQELKVNEGDNVKQGDLLVVLESERARAQVNEISNRVAGLSIARLRAQAEAAGQQPDYGAYRKTHADLVSAQQALLMQNKVALDKDKKAFSEQLQYAQSEYALTKKLYDAGDVSQVELMRTQRAVVDARQKLEAVEEKFKADARKQLTQIEDEITSQRSKLQERQSVLDHTEIRAPVNGIVKFLRINTIGGVLRPGDEIMQISPTEGGYVIEAKVNPTDIGLLHIGQKATVKLDAFDYTIYGSLPGELVYLSSDTLSEQAQNGSTSVYYRARVRFDHPPGSKISSASTKAGMTASIDIMADKRTVLTYLVKPIARAFSGAMGQK
ncbi:HlyD family efflux transporter periplasmic adaptor subunit [Limnohabitans sp.]|uniref:HlyD family efflux transporter periplasmic adaptor subunit n=1 Tax=Limnohabitans sp. TaxID=1907725 RepID=UPI00311D4860